VGGPQGREETAGKGQLSLSSANKPPQWPVASPLAPAYSTARARADQVIYFVVGARLASNRTNIFIFISNAHAMSSRKPLHRHMHPSIYKAPHYALVMCRAPESSASAHVQRCIRAKAASVHSCTSFIRYQANALSGIGTMHTMSLLLCRYWCACFSNGRMLPCLCLSVATRLRVPAAAAHNTSTEPSAASQRYEVESAEGMTGRWKGQLFLSMPTTCHNSPCHLPTCSSLVYSTARARQLCSCVWIGIL
jgi:hypothetical protein